MSGSGSRCCAWVTLATNDTYCLGALVLGHSLKNIQTRHQLAVIITPQVSPAMREQLAKVFDLIHTVDVLDSQDAANLALLQRPDLGVTFTKIHCWTLTQYSKCVFLDADTLVMQNCDELMERDELSAAPDPGWPDCFNSGVFVFVPSEETFKQLIQFASTHGSFDGGDQGLLNMYFNDWPTNDIRRHLSFLYNMCSTSTYTYLPALKYYGANIKIVHFIGSNKPWLLGPSGAGMSQFTQAWWDIFQSSVVEHLSKEMSGLAGALGSKEKSVIEEQWRKQNWEQGNIDFTGKDSFEHIWQKIMSAVNKPKVESPKPAKQTEAQAPKEIASQAISEKEKADIPEPVGGEAVPEQKKEVAPVPPTELNKVEAPLTETTAENPLTAEVPKLPESLTLAAAVLSDPASQVLPPEPFNPETSEIAQILKSVGIVSPPSQNNEPKPPLSQESGELPKIEDILKGLEQTILLAELHSNQDLPTSPAPVEAVKDSPQAKVPEKLTMTSPLETAKADAPLPEIPKTEASKTEKAPEVTTVQTPDLQKDQQKVPTPQPEAPKTIQPEQPKTEPSKPETPKPAEAAPTVKSLLTEVLKPIAPTSDTPTSTNQTIDVSKPAAEAPKPISSPAIPAAPPTEIAKPAVTPAEVPPVIPPIEGPKDVVPPAETPKPPIQPIEAPKPVALADAALKTIASPAEAPQPAIPPAETPKPEVTPIEAPKPVIPSAEAPKPVAPLPEAPKPVVPPVEVPKSVAPLAEAPKSVAPLAEAPKPETTVSEEQKPTQTDAPKSGTPAVAEGPKSDASKADAPKAESSPGLPETKAEQLPSKQAPPVPGLPAAGDNKTVTVPSAAGEKKDGPVTEDSKPVKQQAPQPPPKNGKQKKGQQPEPTTVHPLAETPAQPEIPKESLTSSQDPCPLPTKPESQTKQPEVPPKEPGVQPGTPTVTAPTPPVTPLDASKVEDPLTAQIKSEETEIGGGASSGAEMPVPPKRKGKGNEKQPPKPQPPNGGGKSKGKK